MLARFFISAASLALLLIVPLSSAQDSKSKSTDSSSPTIIDANTLQTGEYAGKLATTPASDGTFAIRIDKYEPKDKDAATTAANDLNAAIQNARQQEQKVAANGSAQNIHALKQAYDRVRKQQARQKDFYNKTFTEIDFQAASDVTVRYLQAPVIYDDKGERKKFTKQELEEMRGSDLTIPGYAAKQADLQPGQLVRVSLRPAKSPPAEKDKPSTASDSEKDKSKPAPKMEATMILIVVAEDTTLMDQDNKDAGKKK